MGHVVIKPVRDRDEYVEWSTIVEAPIAHGSWMEMFAAMGGGVIEAGSCPHCGKWINEQETPEARLSRAERHGSSALDGFYRWDDTELIYQQRGLLPREHLYRAAELLAAGRESEVWDLLAPFEDETEVRRG